MSNNQHPQINFSIFMNADTKVKAGRISEILNELELRKHLSAVGYDIKEMAATEHSPKNLSQKAITYLAAIKNQAQTKETYPITEHQLSGREERDGEVYRWFEKEVFRSRRKENKPIRDYNYRPNLEHWDTEWRYWGGFMKGVPIIFSLQNREFLSEKEDSALRWKFMNTQEFTANLIDGAQLLGAIMAEQSFLHIMFSEEPMDFLQKKQYVCMGCKYHYPHLTPRCAVHPYGPVARDICKDQALLN